MTTDPQGDCHSSFANSQRSKISNFFVSMSFQSPIRYKSSSIAHSAACTSIKKGPFFLPKQNNASFNFCSSSSMSTVPRTSKGLPSTDAMPNSSKMPKMSAASVSLHALTCVRHRWLRLILCKRRRAYVRGYKSPCTYPSTKLASLP